MTRMQLGGFRMMLQAQFQRAELGIEQVRILRAAMDRIAAGTYGRCVKCYGGIGTVRLAALPHANFCIPCQESAFHDSDSGNVGSRRIIEEGGNDL